MGGDALYNRFLLREKLAQISQTGNDVTEKNGEKEQGDAVERGTRLWNALRHYGIIIGWKTFSVWVIEPEPPALTTDGRSERAKTTAPAPASGPCSAAPSRPPTSEQRSVASSTARTRDGLGSTVGSTARTASQPCCGHQS